MERDMQPIHPGEILLEDFFKPLVITPNRLSKSIGVSRRSIGKIIAGQRGVTADTAFRLARFFGTGTQSWVNLPAHYESPKRNWKADWIRKSFP